MKFGIMKTALQPWIKANEKRKRQYKAQRDRLILAIVKAKRSKKRASHLVQELLALNEANRG